MIRQRNLSILSNRLAKPGLRRIPEAVLERDYCLSWFLVGLSHSTLRNRLVFKGGTALKKIYFEDYRFSEDLDFTLVKKTSWEEIRQGLDEISTDVQASSGVTIHFDRKDRDEHENCHTFYLTYEGPLPRQYAASVKVDITLNEHIVNAPLQRPLLRGYKEYEDIPENALIMVYSLDEIVAEKVIALLSPARNEPRDLYDLWFLINGNHIILPEILPSVLEKLEFRGQSLGKVRSLLISKETRLEKLWVSRLESQMVKLPDFQTVFRAICRSFRQAGI